MARGCQAQLLGVFDSGLFAYQSPDLLKSTLQTNVLNVSPFWMWLKKTSSHWGHRTKCKLLAGDAPPLGEGCHLSQDELSLKAEEGHMQEHLHLETQQHLMIRGGS